MNFDEKEDEYYLYQPKGEKYVSQLNGVNTNQDESHDDLFYAKEMNLYNNLQKRLEKQREKKLIEEQQKHQVPWQISKNSRKIIVNKFKDEKPIYERSLELAEKKKRELENASRRMEIEKENEMKKLKTKWNKEKKLNKETFEEFIEKQKLWELNKQTKVTILREEYDEIMKKAIEETMFKPEIGKKPKSIAKRSNIEGKKVHERLYEYNEELKNKKANLEKKNKLNFIPTINKKLPKYLVNKKKDRNEILYFGENNQINYSNDSGFQDDINQEYAKNLKIFLNVEDKNATLIENKINDKRSVDQDSIATNRRNSAPAERKNSNSNVSINTMLKSKLDQSDFDLKRKGLISDLNNINNGGNNLKGLLNEKQENIKIEPKPKNSQEIIYRNMSNGKINKKLSDKFPLERFSVPLNNIKINYHLSINNENTNLIEPGNKNIKRLNSMIPKSTNMIDNNLDMKLDFHRPMIQHQSFNVLIDNDFQGEKKDNSNLSNINDSMINKNANQKRTSSSVL